MNYQKIHDHIIQNTQQNPPVGYVERHHIIPTCMNGNDNLNNLIDLSARQHFIIHWLLTKLYPDHQGIRYAFHMMFHPDSSSTREDVHLSKSRTYEYHKIQMAKFTSLRFKGRAKTPEQREKIRQSSLLRWQRPGEKAAQSCRMMGRPATYGHTGKPHSEATKLKMSQTMKGRPSKRKGIPSSPDAVAKMKATKRSNPHRYTDEEKLKISLALTGQKRSVATRNRIAAGISKTWHLIDPTGQHYTITNLQSFCRVHQLNPGNMSSVASGNLPHHKGWKVSRVNT